MIAGPEIARVIDEFHDGSQFSGRYDDTRQHDQTPSIQTSFAKDVCSLVQMMEELCNPFEEENMDMVALDTKEIAGPAAVEAVQKAKRIG